MELVELEPVGNYAVQPTFSDGHNSGIFSWDYLYQPRRQRRPSSGADYEARLAAAGTAARRAEVAPPRPAGGHGCGHSH